MYRKILTLALFMLIPTSFLLSADSQIEFVAEITAIDTSGEFTVLSVAITPDVSVDVLITDQTEFHDSDSGPLDPSALAVGQVLRVEGIFTDLGLVALEIELASDSHNFDLKGEIQVIGDGTLQVLDLTVIVPPETAISGPDGPISFTELEVGQFVRISGMVIEGRLVARRIKVGRERDHLSPIRFEGLVLELPSPDTMLVEIRGDTRVKVLLTPETEVEGNLAVGVRVRVFGYVGHDLAVIARRVVVLRLLDLLPHHVLMEPSSEQRMVVLLGAVFDRDIPVQLDSSHPDIARPAMPVVVVPAGKLNAVFQILSGPDKGTTEIVAELPEDLGSVQARSRVEVNIRDIHPDPGLHIRWTPNKIGAVPQLTFVARLHLSRPAPHDLRAKITQTRGDDGFVAFPEEVVFPQGEKIVPVPLEFTRPIGQALLLASLPAELGGDTAELVIDTHGPDPAPIPHKVRLLWRPEKISTKTESLVQVALVLREPAPVPFRVVLSLKQGDPHLLADLPAEVTFAAGQREAMLEFRTAMHPGRVIVRAGAPHELGGDHADLHLEIRP